LNPKYGKLLALIGLLLVALNLRTAVSSLAPIIPFIRESFELGTIEISILGMMAPIGFALGGLVAPGITRKLGLEKSLVLLLLIMSVGNIQRAFAPDSSILGVGTLLALIAMGIGNVLLPVVVRKYFPKKIGSMTALYLTVVSISALAPPLIAVPAAEALGWRFSLGQWALVSIVAVIPWLFELRRNRVNDQVVTESLSLVGETSKVRIWKSKTALAILTIWVVSALTGYGMFAWLPQILMEQSGSTALEAGILLSLFAAMGLPAALAMPRLAVRFKNQAPLIYLSAGFFFFGYAGLIYLPTTLVWLWVLLVGLGPILFPLNLALMNLRTESQATLLRLSGFAQGFGYFGAAFGPLMLGVLHELTGAWTIPLWFMWLSTIPALFAGRVIAKMRTVDQELSS
jgi:MFS transporter, CP family, cyanate transporter